MAEDVSRTELRVTRFLSLLPYWVVGLARSLAWLASFLPLSLVSAHRDVVINLLACFPDKDYREVRRLSRRVLVETAHTLSSYSHVWLRPVAQTFRRVSKVHGREQVSEALASERPVLFLSLHQSCWEVPVLELGRIGRAVIMYQPAEGNAIDPVVKHARERTGCDLVPTNGRGVKTALGTLDAGGAFGLLADHQPGGKQNPCAPFFGYEVQVPAFVHKVVARYQPAIFYVSALREPGGGIELFFDASPKAMLNMDERSLLTEMMAGLERIIRRAPEQYNWSYARFRRGPNGKRRWYKKADALGLIERRKAGEPADRVFTD